MSNVITLNGRGTKIIKTDYRQRAFDKKWEKIVKIPDFENKYSYKDGAGNIVNIVPTKWLTVGVFDFKFEPTRA